MSAIDLEAILRGEPVAGAEERRLAEVVALLRANPPSAPAAVRARVAAARPAEPRFSFPRPRRALLVVVAAAVALAVIAALLHGVVGSRTTGQSERSLRASVTTPQDAKAFAGPAGSGAASSGRAPAPTVVGGGRPKHVDASLSVRVHDADRLSTATTDATRIARSVGGYALSVEYRTPANEAYLELRVPTTKVEAAIARLGALGTLVSQQLSVQDLQNELDNETAQIVQLRAAVAAYAAALKDPSLTPVQRVQLQLRLASAKRTLARRTDARRGTLARGAVSRISLVLTTAHAVPVTHHSNGLGGRLSRAVSFLALEATVVLYGLIVLSPFVVLGALAWLGARFRRRREEERLLAA